MKKQAIGASIVLALLLPAFCWAQAPTREHVRKYERAYTAVVHKFGHRAPGRRITRWGMPHRKATDTDVLRSYGVLERMLVPPPPPVVHMSVMTATGSSISGQSGPSVVSTPAVSSSTSTSSGLVSCIISHESGGVPTAVNGKYKGIGQWQKSTWLQDGGGRYSSTPLGASYSQQLTILNGEGPAKQISQQAQYDGCAGHG